MVFVTWPDLIGIGEVVGRTTSPEDAALVIRNAWFRSDAHRLVPAGVSG
jgi:hypothetical protein